MLLRRRHWIQKCTRGGSWQLKALASASRLQSALKTSRFRNHREEAEKWQKGCMQSTSCLSYFWGKRKSFKASPTFLRCFYGPFLQTTGYWSCRPGFQPTGWPAGCERSRVPDRASVSLRPPRCVCAAGRSLRESRRSTVILFSLGGWRKGRPEGRSLEEMRSSLTAAGGGRGSAWSEKKIDHHGGASRGGVRQEVERGDDLLCVNFCSSEKKSCPCKKEEEKPTHGWIFPSTFFLKSQI